MTAMMSKATWMKACACRLGQRVFSSADADDAGREPGGERIEIERRRLGAERLRPRRDERQRDQHRGNREPVEVEQPEDAPGEFRIARRSLVFRRLFHGGTLPRDPRPARGAARVCDAVQATRYNAVMNLHEYQSKRIFAEYGVPVPSGRVAATEAEAVAAARELPGPVWVVKAQVHAGGRGKAGGVKLCRSAARSRQGRQGDAGRAARDAADGRRGPADRRSSTSRPAARSSASCT